MTSDSPSGFPAAHDYGDFIPGWDFFDDFFIRLRLILTIGFEVATMGYIISREEGRSVNPLGSNVLGILVAAPLILTFIAPTNGAGSAGGFIGHLLYTYSFGPFPQVTHFGPPIANTIN